MRHSFEDLELPPELVEALSAEGIEEPSEFQRAAMPVIRRGNNLLGAAGPGAGTLVAYGTALLERTEPRTGQPGALVLAPTPEAAAHLAESLGGIAASTGHVVAALGAPWALPERSDVLFGTPRDVRSAVDDSRLSLEAVQCLVVDGASSIEAVSGLDDVDRVLGYVGSGTQRVILSLPVTDAVRSLVADHVPKAVQVPPVPVAQDEEKVPTRGELRFRITGDDKVDALLSLTAELFADDVRHVLVFCRSEDRAADVGDFMALHGYVAGAPGDEDLPLWLAVEPLSAREAVTASATPEQVATISLDCPADADTMDRRHSAGGRQAIVLLHAREVPHFRDTARRAAYGVRPLPPPPSVVESRIEEIRERLARQAGREDLAPHFLILEPLLERFTPQELAAAALSLLSAPESTATISPAASARAEKATGSDGWTRLFVSIGEMEGIKPGNLLGTLAGESGVDGSLFGKIEIRETFSLVEVRSSEAEKVIKAVNGLSIRGRSTRVDYDRGAGSKGSKGPSRSGRGPGQRGQGPRR